MWAQTAVLPASFRATAVVRISSCSGCACRRSSSSLADRNRSSRLASSRASACAMPVKMASTAAWEATSPQRWPPSPSARTKMPCSAEARRLSSLWSRPPRFVYA